MNLPKRKPASVFKINVSDLSGGINMRDSVSDILDNQLTKCNNMWWNEGMLKTRPGMSENRIATAEDTAVEKYRKIKRHNCFKTIDGVRMQLVSLELDFETNPGLYDVKIYFAWLGGEKSRKLPVLSFKNTNNSEILRFAVLKNQTVYVFTTLRKIYKQDVPIEDSGEPGEDPKESNENSEVITEGSADLGEGSDDINEGWEEVKENEMYIPLIASHCKANGRITMTPTDVLSSGVQFEGFNLLGSYYRLSYNMFNPDIAIPVTGQTDKKQSVMIYGLLDNFCQAKYIGKTVSVSYTDKNGHTYDHSVTYESGAYAEEATAKDDGLRMKVSRNTVWFLSGSTTLAAYFEEDDSEDNLIITAPYISDTSEADKDKIFLMSQTEWFGGASFGLSGGSRLFLCGNILEKEKALVCWSGLNDPLYFSENCYFYVGNTSEAVKGFGRESDMLVILKESGCGVWYTVYRQNTDISASDLINQTAVAYEASSVFFPLVQINPNAGCANPDTVMLCRNRLVWLGNENKVYSLVTENQYNERSVYTASEMVDRALQTENADIAFACDWNGYYCLNFGDTIYLMDYNNYGYTHISGYSKNEDANVHIPWYIWHLPYKDIAQRVLCMLSLSEDLVFFSYDKSSGSVNSLFIDRKAKKDLGDTDIESGFTTKLFSFGEASRRKNIEQVNLLLGNNGGTEIDVRFITDCGSDETETVLISNETKSYDAGYIESKALFPCIRNAVRFGLELSSNGEICIDGFDMKIRTTGGAR